MYGGVSLAIYINGVAQELLRLVRSTAPNSNEDALEVADDDDGFSALDRIYREIGRRRSGEGEKGWTSLEAAPEIPPSRFVVDIITGTSAGGINGVLLAKALANGLPDIEPMKRLWIEEGQLDDLLNEPNAYKTVDDFKYRSPPTSLLAGDRLLDRARKAIAGMGGRGDLAPHYVDELDLTVTMTDLQGLWLPLQLSDRQVWETRHRADLKFIYARTEATGDHRNDFGEMDRLLAFVARATSSFPFAFAPVRLRDGDPEVLKGETRVFGDWASVRAEYGNFAFADGGYLQNKPISHATAHLKRRRADRPVERKLLYLEPDPQPIPADLTSANPVVPDAIENVAAAVGLPRQQPIRQDIEELRARNAAVARITSTRRARVPEVIGPDSSPPFGIPGPYLALRRDEVAGAMADVVQRAYVVQPEGATARAIGMAFLGHALSQEVEPYLQEFDLPFALRRLTYVLDEIDELLSDGGDGTAERDSWLRELRLVVSDRHRAIRLAGRKARARTTDAVNSADAQAFVQALGSWLSQVGGEEIADQASATSVYSDDGVAPWVETFVASIGSLVTGPMVSDSKTPIVALSAMPEDAELARVATALNRIFERAVLIDSVIYPMSWPDLGEARHVAIHRVSPLEAESLVKMPVPDSDQPMRLAGVSMGHFGGFFDRAWRRNDMLWGRLDGAERLIAILVPNKDDRDELRTRAHAAILRDEFGAILPGEAPDDDKVREEREDLLTLVRPKELAEFRALLKGSNDAELVKRFPIAYAGPADPDRSRQIGLGLSASGVGGKVLAGNGRGGISLVGRTVGRLRPLVGAAIRFKERFRRG